MLILCQGSPWHFCLHLRTNKWGWQNRNSAFFENQETPFVPSPLVCPLTIFSKHFSKPFFWGSLCKLPSSWPPAWGTQGRFCTKCCVSGESGRSGRSGSEFREAQKPLFLQWFWALFAGIGDLFLALTFKKPKENQCFWLRTLKNLRKINVFGFEP